MIGCAGQSKFGQRLVLKSLEPTAALTSKSATAAQITSLRESERQHNSHLHELVEIADPRGAMENTWHGCMELNQTYMNDYTTLMARITKLKHSKAVGEK